MSKLLGFHAHNQELKDLNQELKDYVATRLTLVHNYDEHIREIMILDLHINDVLKKIKTIYLEYS